MTPERTSSDNMATDNEEQMVQAGSDQDGRTSPAAAETTEVAPAQTEGEESTNTKGSLLNEIVSLNQQVIEQFESYKNVVQMLNHFSAEYETNLAEITSITEQEDAMYQIPAFLQNLTEVVTRSGLYTDEEAFGIEADAASPWSEEMTRLARLKDKLARDNEDLGGLMKTLNKQVSEASAKLARMQEALKELHALNSRGGT